MDIVITQWALDSYLELKSKRVFDKKTYKEIIRPDVLLLSEFPENPRFGQGKFVPIRLAHICLRSEWKRKR